MTKTKANFQAPDAIFNAFQANLMIYFHKTSLPFSMTAEELSDGEQKQLKWKAAYAKCLDPETKTKVTVLAKKDARKTLTGWLRLMIGKYINGNDGVTDDVRTALGLTVRDTSPTPIPTPSTIPFLEINVQKPLEHDGTLWSNTFKGEKRKNQKKPVGVTLAMVYEGVASLLYRRLKFYFDFYTSKYGCILLKVEYSKM